MKRNYYAERSHAFWSQVLLESLCRVGCTAYTWYLGSAPQFQPECLSTNHPPLAAAREQRPPDYMMAGVWARGGAASELPRGISTENFDTGSVLLAIATLPDMDDPSIWIFPPAQPAEAKGASVQTSKFGPVQLDDVMTLDWRQNAITDIELACTAGNGTARLNETSTPMDFIFTEDILRTTLNISVEFCFCHFVRDTGPT